MANVTYFVALPFVRNEEGELVAGEAQGRQSAGAAESAARRMAETAAGLSRFCGRRPGVTILATSCFYLTHAWSGMPARPEPGRT